MMILDLITTPNGEVTREIHKLFWSGVGDGLDDNRVATEVEIQFTRAKIDFWKEFWETALISYDQRKVYLTKSYLKAKELFDNTNYSGLYNDPQLKSLDNERFKEAFTRILIAASKNETSVVDWSLKRIELNRNVIRMKIVQAYIMHHRLERLRNKDYFKK
jgi:hypothetical protein